LLLGIQQVLDLLIAVFALGLGISARKLVVENDIQK
jgi:hypothetical protein